MDQVRKFRRVFWVCAVAALVATGAIFWRLNGSPAVVGTGQASPLDLIMVLIGIGAVYLYLWLVVEHRILRPLQGLEEDLRAARSGQAIDLREGSLIEPVAREMDKLIRDRAGATSGN